MNTITLETQTWGHWTLEEHPTINIINDETGGIVGTFHVDSVVLKSIPYDDVRVYFITGQIINIDNKYLDVPTSLTLSHCRHHAHFFNLDIIAKPYGGPDGRD